MKERPILMNTENVKAILADRKSQTRRVIKPQPELRVSDEQYKANMTKLIYLCPYGQVGDRLWVRETFCEHTTGGVIYRADEKPLEGIYSYHTWRPSIHMPRWASRITLEITEVRVERVQEITEEDAKTEGVNEISLIDRDGYYSSFADLWDSINAKRGYGWDTNPWVWVISFDKVKDGLSMS